MKTIEAARGKWYGVLSSLGLDQSYLRNKHGPCPICAGKDRYRFDDKDGSGSYYCGGCGAGYGMDLAMAITGLDFKDCARRIDEIVNNVPAETPKPKRDPIPALKRLAEAQDFASANGPAARYLASRGLPRAPQTREVARWKYWDEGKQLGVYPAMVHLFTGPEGEPLTWHVTYLTPDGQKADVPAQRKVMPPASPMSGGAIRLYEPRETLGIAEGVETAIAAAQTYGIPVWSAVSATLLEQFKPPQGVKRVVIFGDNDESFTGQKSAYALAFRLKREGYSVEVRIPETVGDFADEVTA